MSGAGHLNEALASSCRVTLLQRSARGLCYDAGPMTTRYEYSQSELTVTSGVTTENIVACGPFDPNSSGVYRARVSARDQGSDNARSWDLSFAFRIAATGTLTVQGALSTLLDQGTLGALTWSVTPVVVGDALYLQVKGASGKTVDWAAFCDCEWLTQ